MLTIKVEKFQSSFELTGYITNRINCGQSAGQSFQSSFELTGYITTFSNSTSQSSLSVSKLFRAYGLYNRKIIS